jgi:signal transduction histidine kinase
MTRAPTTSDARSALAHYGGRVRLRIRWPPHPFDVLVLCIAVMAEVEVWVDPAQKPRVATAVFALAWTLPLAAWRRFPLGAAAAVFLTLVGESLVVTSEAVTNSSVNGFALVTAFGVAGTHENLRAALAAAGIGFASLGAIVGNESPEPSGAIPIFILGGAVWVLGRVVGERARRTAALEQHAGRLERAQQTAVAAERERIARELHDVVAHSVSVMTVQAGAARLLLGEDPERAREPLLSVERTGRQALADMRRLVGILRHDGEGLELAPQPGTADMARLVDQIRAAGLDADLAVEGNPRPLPPGVDLAAYRIVQEALTNALKHAPHSAAHVRIRYAPKSLTLEVKNDMAALTGGPPGHGILGMRERVTLYGGEFAAGPSDGGYAVRAELPLTKEER